MIEKSFFMISFGILEIGLYEIFSEALFYVEYVVYFK